MKTKTGEMAFEGSPVDLAPWAYTYRKGSDTNPPETEWLWPRKYLKMEVVNGSMVWHYEDTPRDVPKDQVLCAFAWEEPRDVHRVEVEFPAEALPDPGELSVACRVVDSLWEDTRPWKYDPHLTPFSLDAAPATHSQGNRVFRFVSDVERFTKLYVIYTGSRLNIPVPVVRAFGASRWQVPQAVEIEWGFNPDKAGVRWDGRVETYNGDTGPVEPLESGNGLTVLGPDHWREDLQAAGSRRGIRLPVYATKGPVNSRTLVTLWTTGGDFTFSVRDLDSGPILLPSLGVFVAKAGSGTTARRFEQQVAASGAKTLRQRIADRPEQTFEQAMQEIFGTQDFPPVSDPPFEPPMKIDVPSWFVNDQWRMGAWHLTRWAQKLDDETYCVSIWPFNKGEDLQIGVDGREGAAAIGAESHQIIRTLDLIGMHDVAEGGLNYWIHGEHATPFVWGAEVMEKDALTQPYNSPNHRSPGYDQKHSAGHGLIMNAAARHYRLTGNDAWFEKARPVFEKACRATLRVRKNWMDTLPRDMGCYGMIPPANTGDGGETRLYYYMTTCWFGGLQEMVAALRQGHHAEETGLQEEVDAFRQDVRRVVERAAALTPVVKVRDGTYRRFITWQPYLRGSGVDLETGCAGYYIGPVAGGLRLTPDILQTNEVLVQEMLDVYEDVLLSKDVPEPVVGDAWLTHTGINSQCGNEIHQGVLLLNDEVPAYIRSVINGYAAEIDPYNNYVFWEGPLKAGAPDKTLEDATFLERVRMMLVMEEGETLWLGRAIPRAWLEQGKQVAIANAPTFFGPVAYEMVSDVENGKITATIQLPRRRAPKAVLLRLRHPQKAPIQSVTVNGQPWQAFDPVKELVLLEGVSGTVSIQIFY